jgi:hypothetical protein
VPSESGRQPGGFEGLVARPVLAAACDLPVSEGVKGGVSQIRLDRAELGTSADPEDHDDLVVSRVDLLDGVLPEVVERVEPVVRSASLPWIGPWSSGGALDRSVVDVVGPVLDPRI